MAPATVSAVGVAQTGGGGERVSVAGPLTLQNLLFPLSSPGSPECGQHGHAGIQGQGSLDGAAAALRVPGRDPDEGLHH